MVAGTAENWRALARSGQLKPGKVTRRETPAGPVLLGRGRDGVAFALRDLCPHRGAALSAGKVRVEADGRQTVECPYHAWRFHADGTCAAIPALDVDGAFDVSRVRARTYPVTEAGGRVWVWTGDAPPAPPPATRREDRPPLLAQLRRWVGRDA